MIVSKRLHGHNHIATGSNSYSPQFLLGESFEIKDYSALLPGILISKCSILSDCVVYLGLVITMIDGLLIN